MADFEQGFDYRDEWLRQMLLDELFAFCDFCHVGNAEDGALGIGWIADSNASGALAPATDSRNGRVTWTVPASGTLRIVSGPPGSGYGVTSGQRSPSALFRLTPAAASANLSSQRWGFTTPAATDPAGGVYVRSTTTGHLFFVARNETSGAETTYDLGVAPAVDTDYRIFTPDAGVSWLLEINGAVQPVVLTTNGPISTTRLLPELRVVAGGGGAIPVTIDLMFFRAWRSAAPANAIDRITAEDIERRMMSQCLLLWYDGAPTGPAGANDWIAGGLASIDYPTIALAVLTSAFASAGALLLNPVCAPHQNPSIMMKTGTAGFVISTAGAFDQGFGFFATATAQTDGAYFRVKSVNPGPTANLEFVTRLGGVETVTVVSAITVTLGVGITGWFEVRTLDGGTTWQGLRNGVVVAAHTTNIPSKGIPLCPGYVVGADVVAMFAYCERSR